MCATFTYPDGTKVRIWTEWKDGVLNYYAEVTPSLEKEVLDV